MPGLRLYARGLSVTEARRTFNYQMPCSLLYSGVRFKDVTQRVLNPLINLGLRRMERYETYRAAFRRRQDALASNSIPTGRPAKRRRVLGYTMVPEAVKLAVGLLEDEFELREAASEAFPPEITSSHIRASVNRQVTRLSRR
ncbi:hypothetical protein BKA61DRAFT_584833 [Leptodontidium sp. MPI-SDFR-AT-0119]|nr:hypothetical protein BKA61DRAFT_584833 [Leptodontidium sp. MPI-SDFR-AT-0119]